MNRIEKEALTEKVRRADNPYKALFGTDAVTQKGQRRRVRRRTVMPGMSLLPDKRDRTRLAQKVDKRTIQIMKHLDPDLYTDIFEAEMKLAIAKLKEDTPDQELVRKYGRALVPAKTESRAE